MLAHSYFLSTLKEAPADADVISQQYMIRAGMIKKLAAGVYTYMPVGLRTIRKIEKIIREAGYEPVERDTFYRPIGGREEGV